MRFLSIALLVLSFNVFADHHEEKNGENFEEAKKHMLSNMDQRIQNLQQAKSCVSSATNRDGIKACHAALKERKGEMKKKNQELRQQRKSARQARREKKKQ